MELPPLHLLQTLAAFNEDGTAARAAARLKATQPTVTRQLQQLEAWAKTPLFETRGRKKALTDYGRRLAEAFAKRFEDLGLDVLEAQKQWGDPARQRLRIGARREILLDHFAALDFPGRLDLVPMGSRQIAQELAKQTLDLAVVQLELDTPAYVARRFFVSSAALLVPRRWSREAPRDSREVAAICEKHPYATFSAEHPYLDAFVKEVGIPKAPQPRLIASDWPIVEERVHRQLAWTIAPSSLAREGRGYWRVDLPKAEEQVFHLYVRRSLSRVAWLRELTSRLV